MEEPRAAGLGNPLSWRAADRCLAIALLMTAANAVVHASTLAGGWPFLPFPAREAPRLPLAEAVVCGLWLACAAASLVGRRREGGGG